MTNEKKLKFPLEIGDYVAVKYKGNSDFSASHSVCKIIEKTTFFSRSAYVCSNGTLLVPLNFKEDGLYTDARLGMQGPWYSVPDDHTLSIETASYKRQIVECSPLSDAQIDQVYALLKEFHSENGLSLHSFIF